MAEDQEQKPWAAEVARSLIQGYVGPDHKVLNMESFFSALVQALESAHDEGLAAGLALGQG